ncbi:hypothetical protein Gpo141_00014992 [Globisporangium polare]
MRRHFETVEWIHEHHPESAYYATIDCAAMSGGMDLPIYVDEQYPAAASSADLAMYYGASSGKLPGGPGVPVESRARGRF